MKGLNISLQNDQYLLTGAIDAYLDLTQLQEASVQHLILNLQGVSEINSIGVKNWVEGIQSLRDSNKTIEYRACSEVFIMQCNYIAQLYTGVDIHSFEITFMCEECDEYLPVKLKTKELDLDNLPPVVVCSGCQKEMITEEVEALNFIQK